MAVISLLTDFGTRDEYVGAMKGVILGINPQVTLVDVSHHTPPQNIAAAAHILRSAYRCFPGGTIHLAVVDPGVGSARQILAAELDGYVFLAPDNGLLPLVWGNLTPQIIVRVENRSLFRHPVSRTFHGRDIFAPVAAHLSKGYQLTDVGSTMAAAQLTTLDPKLAEFLPTGELAGEVVYIDRFGNLITNIEAAQLQQLDDTAEPPVLLIRVGQHCIEGMAQHYDGVASQTPLALIGSHNCLEIAVAGGSAAQRLGAGQGTVVYVESKS